MVKKRGAVNAAQRQPPAVLVRGAPTERRLRGSVCESRAAVPRSLRIRAPARGGRHGDAYSDAVRCARRKAACDGGWAADGGGWFACSADDMRPACGAGPRSPLRRGALLPPPANPPA